MGVGEASFCKETRVQAKGIQEEADETMKQSHSDQLQRDPEGPPLSVPQFAHLVKGIDDSRPCLVWRLQSRNRKMFGRAGGGAGGLPKGLACVM